MKPKIVETLIVKWRDTLRLYNWNIKYCFVNELKIESKYANLFIEPDILRATIQFKDDCPIDELDQVIVHELMHLRIFSLAEYCNSLIVEFFSPRERTLLLKELKTKEENIIENLVQAIIKVDKNANSISTKDISGEKKSR